MRHWVILMITATIAVLPLQPLTAHLAGSESPWSHYPLAPVVYTGMRSLLSTGFDEYEPGVFPVDTGLRIASDGRGAQYQCVIDLPEGTRALRLWGTSSSPAAIEYRISVNDSLSILAVSLSIYSIYGNETISITISGIPGVNITPAGVLIGGRKAIERGIGRGWNWVSIVYNSILGSLAIGFNEITAYAHATPQAGGGYVVISTNGLTAIDYITVAYAPTERLREVWRTRSLGTVPVFAAWGPDNVLYTVTIAGILFRYFDGAFIGRYDSPAGNIEWSPDGRYLVTDHTGTRIVLYERTSTEFAKPLWDRKVDIPMWSTGYAWIYCSWAPDGDRFIASASSIIETLTGGYSGVSKIYMFSVNGTLLWSTKLLNDTEITNIEWSPDGSLIVYREKRYFPNWTTAEYLVAIDPSGRTVWSREYPGQTITMIRWSPDGDILVVVLGNPYKIQALAPNGSTLWEIGGFSIIRDVAWSPGGGVLAVSTDDGVYVYSRSGRLIWSRSIEGATCLAWHPSGLLLAVGSSVDLMVHVYSLNYTSWIILPSTIVAGSPTAITINHTIIPGSTLMYYWSVGGEKYTTFEPHVNYTPESYGWQRIEVVIVHTETRLTIDNITMWAYVCSPPKPSISLSPASVYVGEPVTLNGSSSIDLDGNITSFTWLVNGTPVASTPVATWTPREPGVYNITLIVEDDMGLRASAHAIIAIEQPPETTASTITTTTTTTTTGATEAIEQPQGGGGGWSWATIVVSIAAVVIALYILARVGVLDRARRLILTIAWRIRKTI